MHLTLPHYSLTPTTFTVAADCLRVAGNLIKRADKERRRRRALNLISLGTSIATVLASSVKLSNETYMACLNSVVGVMALIAGCALLVQIGYYYYMDDETPSRYTDHEKYLRYYGDSLLEQLSTFDVSKAADRERLSCMRELAILNLRDIASKWPWCSTNATSPPWILWNLLAFNEVMAEESKFEVREVWIITSDFEPDATDERTLRQVCKNIKSGKRYTYFYRGPEGSMNDKCGPLLEKAKAFLGKDLSGIKCIHLEWSDLTGLFDGHMNLSVYWQSDGTGIGYQEVLSFPERPMSGGWRRLDSGECSRLIRGIIERTDIALAPTDSYRF